MKNLIFLSKAFVTIVAMLSIGLSASAHDFEADGIYYNFSNSSNNTVEVTSGTSLYSGSVSIPSSVTYYGTNYSVTKIGNSAFYNCYGLTSITIPNSVTSIGDDAFYGCDGLTSITIPNSVTSIGDDAFLGCTGLTSVTIPNSVTTIGSYAFYGCSGLSSVTIPNSVTEIGYHAFLNTGWYNNQAYGILYLDNCCLGYKGNRPTGTLILNDGTRVIADYAFYRCTGLTSVTIPNSVTRIGDGAFSDCYDLTEVNISDLSAWCKIDFGNSCANPLYYAKKLKLNGTVITNLVIPNDITQIKDSAFIGCSGLTSITIPNSVTKIGDWAFYNCTGLTEVTIPNSVTEIGGSAFRDCDGLTSITIPNSVTEIGEGAFYNCERLTSVTIGNSVTEIGQWAFYKCSNLKFICNLSKLTLSKGSLSYGYLAYYASYVINAPNGFIDGDFVWNIADNINTLIAYCGNASELILPNNFNGETYVIGDYAFYNCDELTSVTIGNSVTSIDQWAFKGCSGLTEVTIPNSVTSIGDNAFDGCSGLKELIIEDGTETLSLGYNEYYYYTGKGLFYDCPIEKLYLGRNLSYYTSSNYGYSPFYNCDELTSVTIGNSVTKIGHRAFKGCSGLTSITIPNSVTEIGDDAFKGCSNLKFICNLSKLTLSKGSLSYGYLAYYASYVINAPNGFIDGDFVWNIADNINTLIAYCGNASELILPNNFNGETYVIGDYAFVYCDGLTSVTIPNSVTKIGGCAFEDCTGLTSITIGNSVTEIGQWAFYKCSNLKFVCNLSKLTLSKGSSSYGYLAYYASYVINAPNGFIDGDFVWNIADNINTLIAYCGNASELILPNNFNGETYVIGDYAFYNCDGLTSVTIPNSVTSIGEGAFYNCDGLTSVTIPNSVTSIGEGAFYNCDGLTELIIEDGTETLSLGYNGYYYYTGEGLFYDCPIEKLYLGRNLSYNTGYEYGYSPFYNCDELTSVTIGNSVTKIGHRAFKGCSGLTSITIPNSVTEIGDDAFKGCSLDSVTSYCMTPPRCYSLAFWGSYSAILKVPEGTRDLYANANEWYKFNNIQEIAGVEDVLIDNVVVKIAVENGNISINGIENPHIEIYNINGKCIYSGNDTTIPVSDTGVYILRINGKSYKIVNK